MPVAQRILGLRHSLMGHKSVIKPAAWLFFTSAERFTSRDALNFSGGQAHNGGFLHRMVVGGPFTNRLVAMSPTPEVTTALKYSDNFGLTWATATTLGSVYTRNGSSLFWHNGWLYATNGTGGAGRSNNGTSWFGITLPGAAVKLAPGHGTTLYAHAQSGSTYWVSTDLGVSWTPQVLSMLTPYDAASFPSGRTLMSAWQNDASATNDAGWSDDGSTWNYTKQFTSFAGFGPQIMEYVSKYDRIIQLRNSLQGVEIVDNVGAATRVALNPLPTPSTDIPVDMAYYDDYCSLVTSLWVYRLDTLSTWSRAALPNTGSGANISLVYHPGITS